MDDDHLAAIAARYGTPTYVYDLDRVEAQVARLRAAFSGAEIHYAVKANANGALLRHLAGLGLGVEALTAGELERALRAGFAPERILLGGPGHTPALVARATEAGVGCVSLDGEGAWRLWREADLEGTRFLVRVNPGFDPRTHEHLATAAPHAKFGVPPERATALAAEVASAGQLAGFHVHAGSMIAEPDVARLVVEALAPLYDRFPDLDMVDFGGGFAVPDAPLAAFAERFLPFAQERGLRLVLEPGRFVVADAGILLTHVLHVKHGPLRHVIADAGMADLLRPALYGARHPVRVVTTGARPDSGPEKRPDTPPDTRTDTRLDTPPGQGHRPGAVPTDVDGPLCENADRLARGVELPDVGPGDLLAVGRAGAYGFGMASNYASSLRPAEVVTQRGVAHLARRRETPEDLWRLEDEAERTA
ncbi:MAG: diaminopimelate decarboxylase [Trueperaceae bacterium]